MFSPAVARHDAGWADDELRQVGALVGSAQFQHDAAVANTLTPELHTFDRWGHRIDEVEYRPVVSPDHLGGRRPRCATPDAGRDPQPGSHVARAAIFLLFGQIEPGHARPVSMTHAVIPSLELQPDVAALWVPKALSRNYSPS